ncbi:hypothetical protein HK104_002209 [Borealophlyctis nickersoniae]|nr:hypothetical protein HK104_002209 [Borealophlyctis nickersoniae]
MGVTSLTYVRFPPDSALFDLRDRLSKTLGFRETGKWQVTCRLFYDQKSTTAAIQAGDGLGDGLLGFGGLPPFLQDMTVLQSKLLYLLKFEHVHDKVYSFATEPATMGKGVVVEADRDLELLLVKMKNLWTYRQSATVEGFAFELGDFALRVGTVKVGSASRGLLIQAEHLRSTGPSSSSIQPLSALIRLAAGGLLEGDLAGGAAGGGGIGLVNDFNEEMGDGMGPETEAAVAVDFHDYSLASLKPSEFTRKHEAYQIFSLFRQESIL